MREGNVNKTRANEIFKLRFCHFMYISPNQCHGNRKYVYLKISDSCQVNRDFHKSPNDSYFSLQSLRFFRWSHWRDMWSDTTKDLLVGSLEESL